MRQPLLQIRKHRTELSTLITDNFQLTRFEPPVLYAEVVQFIQRTEPLLLSDLKLATLKKNIKFF